MTRRYNASPAAHWPVFVDAAVNTASPSSGVVTVAASDLITATFERGLEARGLTISWQPEGSTAIYAFRVSVNAQSDAQAAFRLTYRDSLVNADAEQVSARAAENEFTLAFDDTIVRVDIVALAPSAVSTRQGTLVLTAGYA